MLAFLVCSLAVLGATISQKNEGFFELNIIHYNDFHAHYDEVSPIGTVCQPEVKPCIGGFARLVAAVRQAREAEPHSLLLNGGDTFQGTIWYNFMRWNVSQHFMNMLPHDAHVLGNHDFDHGVEGLVPYLEQLQAPMLGANVNAEREPTLAPLLKNHIIVERHRRKIGIIGVLQFSVPIGNVTMKDDAEAVNREAAILTEQGVDIIILLSHVGIERDMALAACISPTVDIIVGAHSHSLLYTGDTPNGDRAVGEYPTVVTQPNGHRIPIVQASCCTRYLGNIKFFIDDQGVVQRWKGQPVFLGTSIIPDAEIKELLAPWRAVVDAVSKEVLGRSLVTLSRATCYQTECNMGSWVCDVFLEEAISRVTDTNWNDVHVCMINAGAMRVDINPGDVTTEALMMAMPYENYLQIYDLKGQHLLEALEYSVAEFHVATGQFYSRQMLQIGGMRNTYNVSAPAGSRVRATIRCIKCAVPVYLPLDPEKTYRIITQSYIGEGHGGYKMLSRNRENVVNFEIDITVLQRYLRKQKVITKDLDGRINIVR